MSRAAALPAPGATRARSHATRYRAVMTGLVLAFAAAILLGVAFGTVWISPWDTLRLVALTRAPAMAAPLGSTTCPSIVGREGWACTCVSDTIPIKNSQANVPEDLECDMRRICN